MNTDHALIDEFEKLAHHYFAQEPNIEKTLNRQKSKITIEIPKKSASGFDVGAAVEIYGIYPWAGQWHGAPWEPMKHWPTEKVCRDFFGFLRTLLSNDAQLRCIYRHRRLRKASVYLRNKEGWRLFEETGYFVIPLGDRKEEIYQNDHLPPRYPYANLESTDWGVYYW